jgi:hypothetical protein
MQRVPPIAQYEVVQFRKLAVQRFTTKINTEQGLLHGQNYGMIGSFYERTNYIGGNFLILIGNFLTKNFKLFVFYPVTQKNFRSFSLRPIFSNQILCEQLSEYKIPMNESRILDIHHFEHRNSTGKFWLHQGCTVNELEKF